MLTGGPNYIMIRRAIFGKVHGHGVKEIWLISQFPAKHTGVASGAKIVFARPGLAKLLGCGHGVINKEIIIYIACSPQSDCISLFRDPSVTFWPSRIRIYVRDVILVVRSVYRQSRKKHGHFSLYVENISGYREKKRRSLKYQNKMSFQISLFHRAKIVVNQNEWKFIQGGGGGVIINSSSLPSWLENYKLRENTGRTAEYMQEGETK